LKIAHVVSGLAPESGGLTVAVLEMARWQSLLGHNCTILTGDRNGPRLQPDEILREAGGSILEFSTRGPQKIRFMPDFYSYLTRRGREFDLYVLHGSYTYPTCAAGRFCHNAGIPYIFVPHGSLDPAVRSKHPSRNRLIDFLYHDRVIRNANAWHFTSEEERSSCERPIWISSFVEPLGIDLERIPRQESSGEFRKRYGIPENAILLLFLSRVTRKKGVDILLQAFRRLASGSADVFLALCGPVDDDMRGLIDAASHDRVMGNRLIVTGLVLGGDKDAAFFDSNYFVLPTYSENFGIAAFEALAYGVPIITTTGMNLHAELSRSGQAKIVSPDVDHLYRGLLEAVTGKWRPSGTPDDARAWLEGNFSWRIRADHLIQRYFGVVRGGEKVANNSDA
jgi:glycosyltransferase involved in cell wall biosynthesis